MFRELSGKYKKTPVQIVLRWNIQKWVITIHKSVTPDLIISNMNIFDFELTDEDMARIDNLDKNRYIRPHPDRISFLRIYSFLRDGIHSGMDIFT